MTFAERIKLLLKVRGETQVEFAEAIGVSQERVSGWLTGKRGISTGNLVRAADHFDVTTDWLLGRKKRPMQYSLDVLDLLDENQMLKDKMSAAKEKLSAIMGELE